MEKLIIFGVKHCGKTSLGKRAAAALDLPFFDLDHSIDTEPFRSVRELYKNGGRDEFQRREAAAARLFWEKSRFVLATGGGCGENPGFLQLLKESPLGDAVKLFINDDRERLYRRIAERGLPPFLAESGDPEAAFAEMYGRRTEIYRALSDLEFHRRGSELDESAGELEILLRALP